MPQIGNLEPQPGCIYHYFYPENLSSIRNQPEILTKKMPRMFNPEPQPGCIYHSLYLDELGNIRNSLENWLIFGQY